MEATRNHIDNATRSHCSAIDALFDEIDALARPLPGYCFGTAPAPAPSRQATPPIILSSSPRLKFTPALLRIPAWLPASPVPSPIEHTDPVLPQVAPFVASPVSYPSSPSSYSHGEHTDSSIHTDSSAFNMPSHSSFPPANFCSTFNDQWLQPTPSIPLFPCTMTHTPFVPSPPLFQFSSMTPPPQQLLSHQKYQPPLPQQTPYIPRRRAPTTTTDKPAVRTPREYLSRREPLLPLQNQFLTSRFEENCKPSVDDIKKYAAVIGKDEKKVSKW
ncbi:hypothetical protein HDU98_002564 [Podochytrium sp. JEL0797]|nr:hypothetical protein HDU98_002564 [Podochytrium sp. JEL0797]